MTPLRLQIATPCGESFDEMTGDGHARFCGKCQKSVHDLSAYTEPAARALLREHAGQSLCVRYAKDATGSLRFKTALLATAMSVAACGAHVTEPPPTTSADRCAMKRPRPVSADAGPDEEMLTGYIAVPSHE